MEQEEKGDKMVNIKLNNVSKIFKKGKTEFKALSNINLEIPDNSFFGILGASGAGKTTTMRIIAGLEAPTMGEVLFDKTVVSKDDRTIIDPEERDIGMVFQNWALYPHMNNYENIAFPLKVKKWNQNEITKRVYELADILGIREVLAKRPGEISGGQQQRVAVARALAKNPKFLLLDEPFSNLDANARDDARALVKKVKNELGITTIIVSHDPADIFALAEKVAVISRGNLVQLGTPKDLYDYPSNERVAGTLGDINIVDFDLKEKNGYYDLIFENFIITGIKLNDYNDSKITLGIRPEDLIIEKSTEIDSNIETKYEGNTQKIGVFEADTVNYNQGSFSVVLNISGTKIKGISREPIFYGDKVNVYINKSKIKLFEYASKDAIKLNEEIERN